jgi:lipid-A-disaccharide synthase
MPGSRSAEISVLLPLFACLALEIRKVYPDAHFIVPYNNFQMKGFVHEQCKLHDLQPVFDLALRSIQASDLVLLSSGTATLEVALLKKPMLVAYQVGKITYAIMRRMVHIPYISLVNIMAGKFIVPEFVQQDASVAKMLPIALKLLVRNSAEKIEMVRELSKIGKRFGGKNPDQESAKAIMEFVKRQGM